VAKTSPALGYDFPGSDDRDNNIGHNNTNISFHSARST